MPAYLCWEYATPLAPLEKLEGYGFREGIMQTRKYSKKDLQKGLAALRYESFMLKSLARSIALVVAGRREIRNAALESFLLHVRILIEFFYNDNPHKDDIVASHFFSPPGKWKAIRPKQSAILKQTKKRAHKLLAHLTYTRLRQTQETKKWAYMKIAGELEAVLNVFYKHLPDDLRELDELE